MSELYHHGIEVDFAPTGNRPIATGDTTIIGLVGTAPDAEGAVAATAATGTVAANNAITWTAPAGAAGNAVSIRLRNPGTASQALAVSTSGTAITVVLATDAGSAITSTAAQVIAAVAAHGQASGLVTGTDTGVSDGTGVVTATARPVTLTGGLDEALPLDTPVAVIGGRTAAARFGVAGTIAAALDGIWDQAGAKGAARVVVVRVAEGVDSAATQSNVIGGVSGTGQREGMQALLDAQGDLALKPKILIAPGFSHILAVGTELAALAGRLLALAIVDAPDGTDQEMDDYAENYDERVDVRGPWVRVWDPEANAEAIEPPSPRIAGVYVRNDQDRGFWESPSNQVVFGILGTSRPIHYNGADLANQANYLNERRVNTIIRDSGYRAWGNRTTAAEPQLAFIAHQRVYDAVSDALQAGIKWAIDRGIKARFGQEVAGSVEAYLRRLEALEAIAPGSSCEPVGELNTPESMMLGKVYFRVRLMPFGVAEHIILQLRPDPDLLAGILDQAAA